MQMPLLSELSVSGRNIIQLQPSIVFDCVVEGKQLKATVTHQEDNGLQFIYHISFSDGHAASFVAPREGGRWNDKAFASSYASAIADDLDAFCGFHPSKPPICIRLRSERESFNVWAVPHVFRPLYYSVFFRGDYQFDVRKSGVWEACSVRENSLINQEIASIVCRNIESRILQPQLF